ncbi:hypothetical protein GOP47_0022335 [Adiantum capillus-veneris]|uniref:GB1/RHD3-type G domain-containing protein n=1 Tax=Adiantum capillus-veneris TaxID=13818 RepID=A0A9D4Z6R4_ADICA|nr:hypothetical protein GOP47_0022335 [Adiantum capillus-veneris]
MQVITMTAAQFYGKILNTVLVVSTLAALFSHTAANDPILLNIPDEEGFNAARRSFDMLSLSGTVSEDAMQLLRPGKGHDRLELSEIVLAKLALIEDPISIVGIVGPYHCGKSFLLNVLLNSTHGFPVGVKPEPETRGMWIRIISKERLKGKDDSQVVLLDTEGFYGERATRLYDARIFAVATLLSSHLVYNTLRTLGDTQSVSALADLAKQAQVFNLQNWLHSGDIASDQPFMSTTVDPSLLLRTLDFPPLTWVVQGFDIDLDSSHTPMDYLQRYLSAFSHTGDRTLDTLFTAGISCYSLRTPTDLNSLREQYGSKVLAADEELYSRLHPGYVSDLDKLRAGVFGNLTTKGGGKLTGKSIAAMLPLLVHYVNEDFPLQADRKLKDVLMDIVVEGAFAGGVEYFQKCMHEVSMIDAIVSSQRGKILHGDSNEVASMSHLATSALTAEELEAVMTAAESRAIAYCKRRCVGVPSHLVSLSCEAQLGIKLNNMKPLFREQNDRKVKEVLVRLGEGLYGAAGKKVQELKLPMADSSLQQVCSSIIHDALLGYEALVGPHKASHLYREACTKMQEEIQVRCEKMARINMEKISAIFSAAKGLFRGEYEHGFLARTHAIDVQTGDQIPSTVEESLKGTDGKPLPPKKLEEIHALNVKVAGLAYEKSVKDALPWMGSGDDLYDFHHFQCLQWLKQRYAEIQAYNNMLIRAFCEKCMASLVLQYKTDVSNITPFPDNDETISEKAEEIAKRLLQEYNTMTSDYASMTAVEEKRKELVHSIEDFLAHILKKNTALMAAFCYDPLMDAFKELRMQDCDRTFHHMWVSWSFWSHRCLWPGPKYMFGFRYAAYKAARKHLDKAQSSASEGAQSPGSNHEIAKGVILSPSTRNKVIQAWIEHDLAPYANVVLVNFSILTASIAVIVGCLLWMLRTVHSSVNTHHKVEPEGDNAWASYGSYMHQKAQQNPPRTFQRH